MHLDDAWEYSGNTVGIQWEYIKESGIDDGNEGESTCKHIRGLIGVKPALFLFSSFPLFLFFSRMKLPRAKVPELGITLGEAV